MKSDEEILEVNKSIVEQIIATHFRNEQDSILLSAFRALPLTVYEFSMPNVERGKLGVEAPDSFAVKMELFGEIAPTLFEKLANDAQSDAESKSKVLAFMNLYFFYLIKNSSENHEGKSFYYKNILLGLRRFSFTDYQESNKKALQESIAFIENELQILESEAQPDPEKYFTWLISDKSLNEVADYLKFKSIIIDKTKFVSFLKGSNLKLTIPDGKLVYFLQVIRHLAANKKALKMNTSFGN